MNTLVRRDNILDEGRDYMETFVREAIENTKRTLPDYWQNTLRGRLKGGVGSIYEQFYSAKELEKALLDANWEETTHPAVSEDCRVFRTNLEGRFGIVEISKLPADAVLVADDRKNTGRVAMTVKGVVGDIVPYTYLITGKEDGVDVVFTFHPGEPIRPSIVEVKDLNHGAKVSKAYAKELSFDLAKIV